MPLFQELYTAYMNRWFPTLFPDYISCFPNSSLFWLNRKWELRTMRMKHWCFFSTLPYSLPSLAFPSFCSHHEKSYKSGHIVQTSLLLLWLMQIHPLSVIFQPWPPTQFSITMLATDRELFLNHTEEHTLSIPTFAIYSISFSTKPWGKATVPPGDGHLVDNWHLLEIKHLTHYYCAALQICLTNIKILVHL